jgi:transposase
MPKLHTISLDEAQRLLLEKTVRSGTASARTITKARILLKADAGDKGPSCIDTVIAEALDVGLSTVERTRKRAATEGIEAAIVDRPRPPKQGKLDGEAQARLIALRCSPAPDGRDLWTLELLASRFSAQEAIPVSGELVRKTDLRAKGLESKLRSTFQRKRPRLRQPEC